MDPADLDPDPLVQLGRWIDEAAAAGIHEPNAMSVATTPPDVRTVLLKGIDVGLVFFTSYRSAKARALEADPRCAASLTWTTLGRQVRAVGFAHKVRPEESDAYFATRPRGSQLAAWASRQSDVIEDRSVLDAAVARAAAAHPEHEPVPRPPHWGGFRLTPLTVEFWSRRDDRLHDRIRYTRNRRIDGWVVDRLAP